MDGWVFEKVFLVFLPFCEIYKKDSGDNHSVCIDYSVTHFGTSYRDWIPGNLQIR